MRIPSCLVGAVVLVSLPLFASAQTADDAEKRIAEPGTEGSATIHFAGDETVTYRGVLVHVDYWLPLPDSWVVNQPALLELDFSHSPVLIERLSSMTASVNDNAIDSLFFNVQNARDGKVIWEIPPDYLKLGDMNKINLTAKMRSDLELCDDVHSPALWMTIQKESHLVVRYAEEPVTLDISRFPESYLRPEVQFKQGRTEDIHAVFLVPKNAGPEVLNGVAVVSARFGAETRYPRGRLEVRQVGDNLDGLLPTLTAHNLIIIGPTEFVDRFQNLDLPEGFISDAGRGYLVEARNPWNSSRRAMVVTGADEQAISKAVTALSLPHLRAQWATEEGEAPLRAVSFSERPQVPDPSQIAGARAVTISMADLGSTDLTERGKFHHFVRIAFPNPYVGRIDMQEESFIRLFISHSELLVPQTSSLLVKINGEPVRSIRLEPRTARALEADVIIPKRFLGDRLLLADLEFFLDIGDDDCHYNFPEMAWATLFNTSFVAYKLTDAPTTSLRSYPWVAAKEDHLNGLVFVVADNTSDAALSSVANIAAFLGKSLPRARDERGKPVAQWVHPWVKRVSELSQADTSRSDLIVVGDYALVQARDEIRQTIPEGLFADVAPPDKLRTYATGQFRAEAGWIHLASSPWNGSRNLLVVSGSRGAPAIAKASEYLWVSRKVDQLGGSTVLVGPNGAMQVLVPAPGEEPQATPAGPLVARVPAVEAAIPAPETIPVTAAAAASAPVAQTTPAAARTAAPASKHQVSYLVFVILGLLLVVLVVVRIRDSVRGDNGS